MGFPSSKEDLPPEVRSYWAMKGDHYVVNNLPFKGKKIVKTLRPIILEGLHIAHQGVSSMLANAHDRFFWSELDTAICLYKAQCYQCNDQAPSQPKEPFMDLILLGILFKQVASHCCKISSFLYLIYVDRYLGWIEVADVYSTGFNAIRKVFLMYFATFELPEEISSEGGSPFDPRDYNSFLI